MIKDRTFEFRSTIDIISGGQTMLTGSSSYLSNPQTSQFLDKANAITREFSNISLKLEQLTKLAKNRSIFDDKPQEFNDLSNFIKRDLSLLNRRIQELKTEINNKNTSGDISKNLRNKNNNENEHQKNVTVILQNWTAQSFKSFENILELRSQTLKNKKDRKDQFGSGTADGPTSFLNSTFRSTTPPQLQLNQQNNNNNNIKNSLTKQRPVDPSLRNNFDQQPSTEFDSFVAQAPVNHIDQSSTLNKKFDDQSHVTIDFSQQQKQQQTLMMEQEPLLGTDSRSLRSRNNALGAIESTINELGSIYQQLAHMVAEQGETVQRIDMNIEDMNTNVLSGQNQLARYLRTVSANRWLVAKMFLALISFIIIFKFLFLR